MFDGIIGTIASWITYLFWFIIGVGYTIAVWGYQAIDYLFTALFDLLNFEFLNHPIIIKISNIINTYKEPVLIVIIFIFIVSLIINNVESAAKLKNFCISLIIGFILIATLPNLFNFGVSTTSGLVQNLNSQITNNISLGESQLQYWLGNNFEKEKINPGEKYVCPIGQEPVFGETPKGVAENDDEMVKLYKIRVWNGESCKPIEKRTPEGFGKGDFLDNLRTMYVREDQLKDGKFTAANFNPFNQYVYRIDGISATLFGMAAFIVFLFATFKICAVIFTLGIQKLMGPVILLMGDTIRKKYIMELFKGFMTIIISFLMFYFYIGISHWLFATTNPLDFGFGAFIKGFIFFIALAFVIIDGDIFVGILGVDSGISSGITALMTAKQVGSTISSTSRRLGNGIKRIGTGISKAPTNLSRAGNQIKDANKKVKDFSNKAGTNIKSSAKHIGNAAKENLDARSVGRAIANPGETVAKVSKMGIDNIKEAYPEKLTPSAISSNVIGAASQISDNLSNSSDAVKEYVTDVGKWTNNYMKANRPIHKKTDVSKKSARDVLKTRKKNKFNNSNTVIKNSKYKKI